ncbi:LOW QUALITY PROTEIN: immunoglobulin superfamily member 1-like, partial [Gallus gallus]|uniref:LOW QUALITY PROTEIN: immunoglobulin superfamily member 1-like n=1 Tax=Gallus gallus TaxID=9031 RepID=UPI001F0178C1
SLSLHPSQGVSLGDTVTLRCHLPQSAAQVELYQDGLLGSYKDMDKHQVMAEFSLVCVKLEDAMKYWCQYWVLEPPGVSEKSVPIELVVTDHQYSPPNISISHEKIVEVGTNVTIKCCNQGYGGIIFLHKDGHSAPVQHQDPRGGGTATFILVAVTSADSGTYRCSYHPKASLFVSSPLGDSVMLEVTPTPAPPGDERRSRGNLVVAVVRGCTDALTFGLGIFFVIDAQNLWIRRDVRTGADTKIPKDMQFQVETSTFG